ncbi:MAG: hypothetical protein AAF628_13640 [Planctomycetota bacterium]
MHRSLALFFSFAAVIPAASAQDWTLLSPPTAPSPRLLPRASLVDNPATGRLFFFGGWAGGLHGPEGDETWEFDGTTWIQRMPATQPPRRLGETDAAVAVSPSTGRILLYGGSSATTFQSILETWEWDGNDWSIAEAGLAPGVTSPNAVRSFSITEDYARNRVVLFGGLSATGATLDETWEWDGASWIQRFPANAPSPRGVSGMAYDAVRSVVVLYGGSGDSANLDDTWEWDGTDWRQVFTPNPRMPAAAPVSMTYDASRQRIVARADRVSPDTWEYDGTDWHLAHTATPPPGFEAMQIEYHSASQRVIAFGGRTGMAPSAIVHNETWAYGGAAPFFETYGTGCPGSLGAPGLTPTGSSPVPALGASFDFDLGPVAASGIVVAIGAGASTTPINLRPLGAPACWLYALSPAGMLTLPWPVVGNTASVSFRMPTNPVFAGGVIELQGVAPDATAPGQLITTHGGRGTLR